MRASLKAGIISGLIAGIVLGIVSEFSNQIAVLMGLYEPFWQPITINNIAINIPLFGFWGIILGILYSKAYNITPKRGIWKGIIYGLFLWFIISFRIGFFYFPYGRYLTSAGIYFSGCFIWLSYGLVLGILYEFLSSKYYPSEKEFRIKEYDIKSGVLIGAIAGFSGGMAASVSQVIGHVTGYWGIHAASGQLISTIDFWMSQVGTHILLNMIWGTIFGALFAKVYNLVPGKKVIKGLYYGLIMFSITTFQYGTWIAIWQASHNNWPMATFIAGTTLFTGGAQGIVFGLVLGLLYRKPTEAIAVQKEKPKKGFCKHCGTKIPRDSKFCKKCGKKQ